MPNKLTEKERLQLILNIVANGFKPIKTLKQIIEIIEQKGYKINQRVILKDLEKLGIKKNQGIYEASPDSQKIINSVLTEEEKLSFIQRIVNYKPITTLDQIVEAFWWGKDYTISEEDVSVYIKELGIKEIDGVYQVPPKSNDQCSPSTNNSDKETPDQHTTQPSLLTKETRLQFTLDIISGPNPITVKNQIIEAFKQKGHKISLTSVGVYIKELEIKKIDGIYKAPPKDSTKSSFSTNGNSKEPSNQHKISHTVLPEKKKLQFVLDTVNGPKLIIYYRQIVEAFNKEGYEINLSTIKAYFKKLFIKKIDGIYKAPHFAQKIINSLDLTKEEKLKFVQSIINGSKPITNLNQVMETFMKQKIYRICPQSINNYLKELGIKKIDWVYQNQPSKGKTQSSANIIENNKQISNQSITELSLSTKKERLQFTLNIINGAKPIIKKSQIIEVFEERNCKISQTTLDSYFALLKIIKIDKVYTAPPSAQDIIDALLTKEERIELIKEIFSVFYPITTPNKVAKIFRWYGHKISERSIKASFEELGIEKIDGVYQFQQSSNKDNIQSSLRSPTQSWKKVRQLLHQGVRGVELEESLESVIKDANLRRKIIDLQHQGKSPHKILEAIKKDLNKASNAQKTHLTHLGGLVPEQMTKTFTVHTPESGFTADRSNHTTNPGFHSFESQPFDPSQKPPHIDERYPLSPSQTGLVVYKPGRQLNEQDIIKQGGTIVTFTLGAVWSSPDPETLYTPDQQYYEVKQLDHVNDLTASPVEFTPIAPDETSQKPFYQHDYVQNTVAFCTAFANAMVKDSGIYRTFRNPEIARIARQIQQKGVHKVAFDLVEKMQQQTRPSSNSSSSSTNAAKNTRGNQATRNRAANTSVKSGSRKFKRDGLQNTASQSYRNTNIYSSSRGASTKMGIDMRGTWKGAAYPGWNALGCK